jgi:hypothetical protein
MEKETFAEQIWRGLGDGVQDIREKVVEEPWYGRTVTDGPESQQWRDARESEPSAGSSTHVIDKEPTYEKEKGQDVELDR